MTRGLFLHLQLGFPLLELGRGMLDRVSPLDHQLLIRFSYFPNRLKHRRREPLLLHKEHWVRTSHRLAIIIITKNGLE